MKKWISRSGYSVIAMVVAAVLPAQEAFQPLRGAYMGQEAGREPTMFLPGKITTGADEGSSLFFRDARSFLWKTRRGADNVLLLLEDREGRWQPPRQVDLVDRESGVWDFTLSPKGDFVYFTSNHVLRGAKRANLWRSRIRDGEFDQPEPLGLAVNSALDDSHPSLTREGVLYFFRWDPETPDSSDLFRAKPAGDGVEFEIPERLSEPVNSDSLEYDPFVAADGSYLIFGSRKAGGEGQGDLYIAYPQEDGWSTPVNLGPKINSPAEENRPSVTRDGRYFFFVSNRESEVQLPRGMPPANSMPGNGSRDIYWMKADFIEELRPDAASRR
jgi:WD40 repeat protein